MSEINLDNIFGVIRQTAKYLLGFDFTSLKQIRVMVVVDHYYEHYNKIFTWNQCRSCFVSCLGVLLLTDIATDTHEVFIFNELCGKLGES